MVGEIKLSMERNGLVEMRKLVHFGSLYVLMSVFGRKYNFGKEEGLELEKMVKEGYELPGAFNWSNHWPSFGFLDLQGMRKRCRALLSRVEVLLTQTTRGDAEYRNFVDALLGLDENERLSDSEIVSVLWETIFRGTDTVAILLEWTMTRMVPHPDVQAKAQAEIDAVVGNSRVVSDSDIERLPFLQAIVKETFRMHPPGPLLSWARLAIHDVHVGHHLVPVGTTAMVNRFKPERFLDEDVNILDCDLRLAPLGAGTRVCPGKATALATVHLWLPRFLQSLWLPVGDSVDLSEILKMSLEMKSPLLCRAVPRCLTMLLSKSKSLAVLLVDIWLSALIKLLELRFCTLFLLKWFGG